MHEKIYYYYRRLSDVDMSSIVLALEEHEEYTITEPAQCSFELVRDVGKDIERNWPGWYVSMA